MVASVPVLVSVNMSVLVPDWATVKAASNAIVISLGLPNLY